MGHGRFVALAALGLLVSVLPGCGGGSTASVDCYINVRLDMPVGPGLAKPVSTGPPAGESDLAWLLPDMDKPIGAEQEQGQPAPGGSAGRVHWSKRRGPAYKGDWLHSFGRDAKEIPATMWDDTRATFTDPWALVGLGVAGAAGIAINASGADDCVDDHYSKNGSQLNKFWDNVGDVGGNPGIHFAFAGAMYFTTLVGEDVKNYEVSKALMNALAINGLATIALKGVVRTYSPNGDSFGWPSGHTSSTFCLATVMHEAYGPWVGVPLFAFAGFVGYERVDARNHDFSDVISGAVMGVAIGHAVMQNHKPRILGFEAIPWADPQKNAIGLALVREF